MAKQKQATKKKSSTKRGQTSNQRSEKELSHLGLGDKQTEYPTTYSPDVLETFPNQHSNSDAWTTFICPEFTSLCPKTGQPDFAKIVINYIADKKMVESKSLKIYLFSFRNHGDFHEDCIQKICDDLQKLMTPKYLEVVGEFTPRGGLAIFPYASCDNGQKAYKELRQKRLAEYSPGKYSMELGRPYS